MRSYQVLNKKLNFEPFFLCFCVFFKKQKEASFFNTVKSPLRQTLVTERPFKKKNTHTQTLKCEATPRGIQTPRYKKKDRRFDLKQVTHIRNGSHPSKIIKIQRELHCVKHGHLNKKIIESQPKESQYTKFITKYMSEDYLLVYIDETGINKDMYKRKCWQKKG